MGAQLKKDFKQQRANLLDEQLKKPRGMPEYLPDDDDDDEGFQSQAAASSAGSSPQRHQVDPNELVEPFSRLLPTARDRGDRSSSAMDL